MTSLILTVEDESMVLQIKRACQLLKGVVSVKVEHPKEHIEHDITKTDGYKEAWDDVEHGRVTEYKSTEELFAALDIKL